MLHFNKINLAFLFFILILFTSCKKQQTPIPVQGIVQSLNEANVLDDVKVELFTRKIESGIYSANYVFFDSTRTDESGAFSFELPRESWAAIKIFFSKTGYYNWEFELEGEVLVNDEGLNEIFSMDPVSWIRYLISNTDPFNDQDRLELRLLNGSRDCEACCSGDMLVFQGTDYNEKWVCQVTGHQDLVFQWGMTKNGVREGGSKSFFVPAGDTIDIIF